MAVGRPDHLIQLDFYLYPVTFGPNSTQPVEIRLYFVRVMCLTI